MNCKKCEGRVFLDRTYSEKQHIELFCIMCGARWMLDKNKNRFAAWLTKMETALSNAASVTG